MENLIINLNENFSYTKEMTGNKAKSLMKLNDKINIPDGIVITSSFFINFLEKAEIIDEVQTIIEQSKLSGKERIKSLIYQTPFPEEIKNELIINTKKLHDKLAIRSSFLYEDNYTFSGAGQFETFLDVDNEYNTIENYLKKCWFSFFDSYTLKNKLEDITSLKIPVIIQNYIKFEKMGVAFSINPIDKSENIIIESSTIQEEVVNGTNDNISSYKIDKNSKYIISNNLKKYSNLSKNQINKLILTILSIEKDFNFPVDIEWGIDFKGTLWILQTRAITGLNTDISSHNSYNAFKIDIDDERILEEEIGYELSKFLKSHWNKRRKIRSIAKNNNINYIKTYFLFNTNKINKFEELEGLLKDISTENILIKTNKTNNIKTQVTSLQNFYNQIKSNNQNEVYCISEFIVPEYSGLSSQTSSQETLIEYIPGDIYGIFKNNIPFSHILTDENNEVLDRDIKTYEKCWSFDIENMIPLEEYVSGEINPIDREILKEIKRITYLMNINFGEVRVEWMIHKNSVYIYDLTLENNTLSLNFKNKTSVLSPGNISGKVLTLNEIDLEKIKEVISKRRSVIPRVEELEEFEKEDSLSIKNKILKNRNDKPIIVAPYPDLNLCLFLEEVSGFIFDRGAVLSHMGIILREANIPAIFLENATTKIKEDDLVYINNDNVTIINELYGEE